MSAHVRGHALPSKTFTTHQIDKRKHCWKPNSIRRSTHHCCSWSAQQNPLHYHCRWVHQSSSSCTTSRIRLPIPMCPPELNLCTRAIQCHLALAGRPRCPVKRPGCTTSSCHDLHTCCSTVTTSWHHKSCRPRALAGWLALARLSALLLALALVWVVLLEDEIRVTI